MKLLDSNILIYAAQPGRDDLRENILAEVAAVSVATLIEVLGYHLLTREEEADLRALLGEFIVLPADLGVAERAVALRQQRKMTLGDAIIAATALVHDLPLLTRNVEDFKGITNLRIENPLGSA